MNLNTFERVIRKLKDMEDLYTIIFKIEMFSDVTGDVSYLTSTNDPWKYAFPFSDLDSLNVELNKFEEYLKG